MNTFNITIKKETLYKNEGGAVVGDICFCVGNWYFPDKAWDDFVVRILYWFSQKLIKLRFDKKKYLEFPFMEGDFKTSLSLNKENKVTVEFIEGDSFADQKETILKTICISFEDLKEEVKKSCKLLLDMKESKELDFMYDYEDLKESYELLCKC